MKSAVFMGRHDIRVIERNIPEPNAEEVIVQVMACGVCGSDLHIYEGEQGSTTTVPPLVPGHEFSGIITKIGSGVINCRAGDRVCIDPADYCGACYYCASGMMSHCDRMLAIGTNVDGGFAQYSKVKSRLIHHLEDHVSFIEGAMAEPLACCLNGIDRSGIKPGNQAVIYGGGMIGLLMLQLAKRKGASKLALIEPVAERRSMAQKLGADVVIDPLNESVTAALAANKMIHISTVIECCGLKSTAREAIEIVDRQGTVVLFAVTAPEAVVDLKTYMVFQKEITVCGSYCSPYTMTRAVELINNRQIDVTSMLGGTEPLEGLAQVLGNAQKRAKGKFIILPNDQID